MPPKAKFTKEEIVSAAVSVVRKSGGSALTARSLGAELGCSARPIFGLFSGMDEVKSEVLNYADKLYKSYMKKECENSNYPTFKAMGLGYIRFSKEEPELFKFLFMRDRSKEKITEDKETTAQIVEAVQQATGLSEDKAYLFYVENWIFAHGFASNFATGYVDISMDDVSEMMTDIYEGLKARYATK